MVFAPKEDMSTWWDGAGVAQVQNQMEAASARDAYNDLAARFNALVQQNNSLRRELLRVETSYEAAKLAEKDVEKEKGIVIRDDFYKKAQERHFHQLIENYRNKT